MTLVLGVDIDGVIANYVDGFAFYAAAELGCAVGDLPPVTTYDLARCWPFKSREHYLTTHQRAVHVGLLAQLPQIRGAGHALRKLNESGVFIRLISSRLVGAKDPHMTVIDTASWLGDNDIPYDDLCFVGDKTSVACDVLIDDNPDHVRAHLRRGNRAAIFHQRYNTHVTTERFVDWIAVTSHFLED